MDQSRPGPPYPPAAPGPAAPPRVLQVVTRTGGFQAAIGLMVGLLALGAIFVVGLIIGAATILAGTMEESAVVHEIYRKGDRSQVAIIEVKGLIDPYRAEVVRLLADEVLATHSIKAVVLRVDSPGGGVAASDEIWYQVKRLRDAGLPVVASYGGLAASGGYYISCGTDHIVAEPTCITGSIGVIAQSFILSGLLDKVGIEAVTLMATDSPEKDLGNPFREWTDVDRQRFTAMLDAAYEIFNTRVWDGRKTVITDRTKLDALANGAVYTADDAVKNGLVDSVGYLDDAIAAAESRAGIRAGRSTVVTLREPASLLGGLLGVRGDESARHLGDAESIRSWVNELGAPRLMYLMR
jgi:protease-4